MALLVQTSWEKSPWRRLMVVSPNRVQHSPLSMPICRGSNEPPWPLDRFSLCAGWGGCIFVLLFVMNRYDENRKFIRFIGVIASCSVAIAILIGSSQVPWYVGLLFPFYWPQVLGCMLLENVLKDYFPQHIPMSIKKNNAID